MAVNPNLATLMRIIEDQQYKMPEGEYIQAMDALCALHRTVAVPVAAPVAVTVYTPAFATCAAGIVTDCPVAVYPLGPVQA